jgi:glycosyltransferase involved in cell wall biosynthesis
MYGLKGIPFTAGIETVVEEIGCRLADRGHDVYVFVRPHYTPVSMKTYRGMKLVQMPSINTKNLDAVSHSFVSTFGAISLKPDVIHIHATGNSIHSLLPRVFGIPTVVTSHGLDWQRAKWGAAAKTYLKFTDYTTCYFPSATTAVSRKMKAYYEGLYGREVHFITNGANPPELLPPDQITSMGLGRGDYLLFASRLVPEKGCHYLIDAFKTLNTKMKLVIAGDGAQGDPYAGAIKKEASPNILFPGFVKGTLLKELLSNCYTYVLPSEIEGLSAGLLEAMSYGKCVLVSNIEENLEAVQGFGFTFETKNVTSLREKLEYLLNHESEVVKKGQEARQYVEKEFNWDEITTQYENLYRSLL